MTTESDVLFEKIDGVDGQLGVITLNRPRVLNALNQEMFIALREQLQQWSQDESIKAVVIQAAEGRAFCAGGDIKSVYERRQVKDDKVLELFAEEYRMNMCIYHFPKPYIALMDGITMGGGVGVSIHGSHRVGTDRYLFAMPETRIGFYPDIGATYFLPRLPHKIGFYLGLTGARLNHADCHALGMLDHIVKAESFADIRDALVNTSLTQHAEAKVSDILNQYSVAIEKSTIMQHVTEIATCFSKKTMEDIIQTLEHYPSAWCEEVTNALLLASPTSLKVTLRQLQEGSKLAFDDCMKLEYRMTARFLHGHDFYEGVRAALIEKDNKPRWEPSTLEGVKASDVETYFSPLKTELA